MSLSSRLASAFGMAAIAVALLTAGPGTAAAGAPVLDPTFGEGGRVEPTYEPSFVPEYFTAATVGADGSFLAFRQSTYTGHRYATVERYLSDGNLDPTFEVEELSGRVEAVDSQGRTLRTTSAARELERLNPDGSIDHSFAAPGYQVSSVVGFEIEAILPLPSGKVLVAGTVERARHAKEIALARLDGSGSLDPGFGGDGKVFLARDDEIASDGLVGPAIGAGEDVLVAANEEVGEEGGVQGLRRGGSLVVAIGADGRPDRAYGTNGTFRSADHIGAIEGLPGGGLLVVGEHWVGPQLDPYFDERSSDVYLTRLTASGAPDPTFGEAGGRTIIDLGGIDIASSVLVRTDGSIVVGGATTVLRLVCARVYGSGFCEETPTLEGFDANGAVDRAFGRGGVVRLGPLTSDAASAIAAGTLFLRPLPGGGLLAGGGTAAEAFLAEVGPQGSPSQGFGEDGIVTAGRRPKSTAVAQALATDGAGRILALGKTDAGRNGSVAAVFRFRPNGSRDGSYGDGRGFVPIPGNPIGLAVDRGGAASVLAGKLSDNEVIRVTAAGRLDPRFGVEGVAPLPENLPVIVKGGPSHAHIRPRAIAALPDGGVLVAAVSGYSNLSRIYLFRLTRAGAPDRSFGEKGVARVELGPAGGLSVRAMAAAADGRIVLAGSVRGGKPGRERQTAAVIRLLPDGRPDPSFGDGGLATLPVAGRGLLTALAIGPRGEVVAGGRHVRKHRHLRRGLTVRFSASGVPDRGFVRRAARTLAADPGASAGQVSPPVRVLLWDDRVVLLPIYSSPFATVYSADGTFRERLAFGKLRGPPTHIDDGVLQGGDLVVASRTRDHQAFTLSRLPGRARR